jgi:uncharacterized repeat protein (TIGR03803 family)
MFRKSVCFMRVAACSGAVLFGVLLGSAAPAGSASAVPAFSLLYSFTGGSDGAYPTGITIAGQGNLFGTAEGGGTTSPNCNANLNGCGVVFKVSPNRTETVVLSLGDVVIPTRFGGASGNGAVLKLLANGTHEVFSFNGTDGTGPNGSLLADTKGSLYGTTESSYSGAGIAFQLSVDGTETVLHTFGTGTDVGNPVAGLIADTSGNLFGTAPAGGSCGGGGGVFELSPPVTSGGTWTYSLLYSFCSGSPSNGWLPTTALAADSAGNLYGTAMNGGAFGFGVIFELSPPAVSGGTWSYKLLYSFTGVSYYTNLTAAMALLSKT